MKKTNVFILISRLEVGYILRTSFVKGFSTALGVFTERFILFSAIATFVLIGGDIRAQITFSLVQYFNLMQMVCNICMPMGLAYLAETKVTIRRLEVSHWKIHDKMSYLTNNTGSIVNDYFPFLSGILNVRRK